MEPTSKPCQVYTGESLLVLLLCPLATLSMDTAGIT
jgi:hypothetical protein